MAAENINIQTMNSSLQFKLKWLLPIVIFGSTLFIAIGFFFTIMSFMQSADAYQAGVAAAQKNIAVINLIGEPMEPAGYFTGSITVHNSNGSADIAISIKGSKGTGTIYVKGEKKLDIWNYSFMVFRSNSDNSLIELQ